MNTHAKGAFVKKIVSPVRADLPRCSKIEQEGYYAMRLRRIRRSALFRTRQEKLF